jgi:hypothetical protein
VLKARAIASRRPPECAAAFSRRDQHGVEPHIENFRIGVGGEPGFRRGGDPLLLARKKRFRSGIEIGARLYLYEYQ